MYNVTEPLPAILALAKANWKPSMTFKELVAKWRGWYPEFHWLSDLELLQKAESRAMDLEDIAKKIAPEESITPLEKEKVATLPYLTEYLQ